MAGTRPWAASRRVRLIRESGVPWSSGPKTPVGLHSTASSPASMTLRNATSPAHFDRS
ncbi:Uncharacterised protein [Mycobacteroides abscessus subsp. abscessus]|nr:Uncharacterised protein [Mycobacteroides abscessus subsp. abscessus]